MGTGEVRTGFRIMTVDESEPVDDVWTAVRTRATTAAGVYALESCTVIPQGCFVMHWRAPSSTAQALVSDALRAAAGETHLGLALLRAIGIHVVVQRDALHARRLV